jgi:hypothetical protein
MPLRDTTATRNNARFVLNRSTLDVVPWEFQYRRAQGGPSMLRSIRPTRAKRPFDASVDLIAPGKLARGGWYVDDTLKPLVGTLRAEGH